MDFESNYEITQTVDFIRSRNYTKVVLQFPDELLKDSARVSQALKRELGKGVRLYVMADTAYNSCCVDEIGASHVGAECVVHYGHACMSPTSNLPALFVFGKSPIDFNSCTETLLHCMRETNKPILVLYGLEFAHAIDNLKEVIITKLSKLNYNSTIHYAETGCSVIYPSVNTKEELGDDKKNMENNFCKKEGPSCTFHLGGLNWNISSEKKIEDYVIFWIGPDNSAFANVVLTFNNCEIVRYDPVENKVGKDVSHLTKILKRRYYLVEKAKDASIVGILVGTLGVAGYLNIIEQLKKLIESAGKKSYTLVMGRPNSAKLANFPECEIFVYVSCAQTALLDSKDFLSPVITPFEALVAFSRGRQWTGEYSLDFQDLISSNFSGFENNKQEDEARFSFIKGGYVDQVNSQENGEVQNGEITESPLALSKATEKALSLKNQDPDSVLFKGSAKTGSEFFLARSFQGLNPVYENPLPQSYLFGRSGRASGYKDEKIKD